MREKLMDIVCESIATDRCVAYCNYPHCGLVQTVVRNLIANGVTIPVRCKDCKHWKHIEHVGCSDLAKVCMLANYMIGANGYCLYGERRTDETD